QNQKANHNFIDIHQPPSCTGLYCCAKHNCSWVFGSGCTIDYRKFLSHYKQGRKQL
ncbi:MAG: hypothetical protein ACJAZG_001885, partial [Granulosicoccus sp.]